MTAAVAPTALGQLIPIGQLIESPWNTRKHFDQVKLQSLADNIGKQGIITPLVARETDQELVSGAPIYELAAGHRRFRAAQIAGLEELPVIVREMDDVTFLEVLQIENLQREDIHPLEEAAGYVQLMKRAEGYDVATIAAKVGKSEKYIYDRIKLLQLTDEMQKLFLDGKITAGHAILLARLSPADQKRAAGYPKGGLWESEANPAQTDIETLLPPAMKLDSFSKIKPKSVRELQGWINDHVRFNPETPEVADLFPETHAAIAEATEMNLKVIPIAHDHFIQPEAKVEGERTFGPTSWKRADGRQKSKTCEYSQMGYVAAGEGRGDAFKVCTNKKKCAVHWPDEVRAAAARDKEQKKAARPSGSVPAEKELSPAQKAKADREAAQEAAENALHEFKSQRWGNAQPELLKRLAAHLKKMGAGMNSTLAKYLFRVLQERELTAYGPTAKRADKHVKGSSADDLVRWLVFVDLSNSFDDYEYALADCKSIGFDLDKALEEIEPTPKPEKAAPRSAKKKGR
jgi:ParB/RepB/Spo0J family partition protein